jgi:circadian clock protein KaiC
MFDEGPETFVRRAQGLNADVERYFADGRIVLTQVDPAELSPGEFADRIRAAVTRDGVSAVVIDSLNGYMSAMPEERFLMVQLHELFMFMRQRGTLAIAIVAQHGLIGQMQSPVDLSYLADNVVLTRFYEAGAEVRRAISMIKKRSGPHQRTIHDLLMTPEGITIGEPLVHLQGVLTGVPVDRPAAE